MGGMVSIYFKHLSKHVKNKCFLSYKLYGKTSNRNKYIIFQDNFLIVWDNLYKLHEKACDVSMPWHPFKLADFKLY